MTESEKRTDAGLDLNWIETVHSPPDAEARQRGDRPGEGAYHGIGSGGLSIDGERTQGLMHRADDRTLELRCQETGAFLSLRGAVGKMGLRVW